MEKIFQFLKDCKVFFLATSDGDQARVRPMGFVMVYEGKLCFGTNNKKPMFQQMKANPKVEICATTPDLKTLRVSGPVAFHSSVAAKEKALEVAPQLKRMYSADDDIFEVFYLESGVAIFSDMAGGKEEIAFWREDGAATIHAFWAAVAPVFELLKLRLQWTCQHIYEFLLEKFQKKPFKIPRNASGGDINKQELYDYCMTNTSAEKYQDLEISDGFITVLSAVAVTVNPDAFIALQDKLLVDTVDKTFS